MSTFRPHPVTLDNNPPVDDFRWSPNDVFFLLFFEHFIQNGHDPILELAIVIIGYQQISDPVDALISQRPSVQSEIADESRGQTLDEVFFDAAGRGHDTVDHGVLGQEPDCLPHAARGHVRGVTQENGAIVLPAKNCKQLDTGS